MELLGSLSGLQMNTAIIWIGSKKYCKEKLNISVKLHWGDIEFSSLCIDFQCI